MKNRQQFTNIYMTRSMVILYYEIHSFRIIESLVVTIGGYVATSEPFSPGFAEHCKVVTESSEFHLTLDRAHRGNIFDNCPIAENRSHPVYC